MPADDPFRAAHLIGSDWEGFRWFDGEEERDRIFAQMERQPPYYRQGDTPNQVLAKIEEDAA